MNELWLIWKQPETRRRYKIGSLTYDGNQYVFKYINPEIDDARKAGFTFYPGFNDINIEYRSNSLFPNIKTRLPNVKRPDYNEILKRYNLNVNSTIFEILEATRGRLITDTFEFVPAFNSNMIVFDVAGTRHASDIGIAKDIIELNDSIVLENDDNNLQDKYAIKVYVKKNNDKYHLGYVPRYYTKELREYLLNNSYKAFISRLILNTVIKDDEIRVYVKLILE